MPYSIITFVVLFVVTAIVHKPLNAHATEKKWLQTAHVWLEIAVVVQGMILLNMAFGLLP